MYHISFRRSLLLYLSLLASLFLLAIGCRAPESSSPAPTETSVVTPEIIPVDDYFEIIADNVTSRQGPSLTHEPGLTYNKGDMVLIRGLIASGEWYQIAETEWIAASFVVLYDEVSPAPTTLPPSLPPPTPSPTTSSTEQQPVCNIIVDSANLRAEPLRESSVISILHAGNMLPILAKTTAVDGAVWYSAQLEDASTGWIISVLCAPVDDSIVPIVPFTFQPPATAVPRNTPPPLVTIVRPTATTCITRNCR